MTETNVHNLRSSMETTQVWLRELAREAGFRDESQAYSALRACSSRSAIASRPTRPCRRGATAATEAIEASVACTAHVEAVPTERCR